MRGMKRAAIACLFAALACGGSSSPTGPATFNGTVRGQHMTPADAVSSPATVAFNGAGANVAAIVITDAASVCPKVSANATPKSAKALLILLGDVTVFFSLVTPTAPATFTVVNPSAPGLPPSAHIGAATFQANDASCVPVPSQSAVATSGTVNLTAVSAGAYTGTYNITFETGEVVTGDFHTTYCPGLATYVSLSTHTCG